MITRKEYMNNHSLHHAFYLEIAIEANLVVPPNMIEDCKKSTNPTFNDVQLKRWDNLSIRTLGSAFKKRGDFLSLAGQVCAYKSLARHIVDNEA